ncbi:MAG: glycosyltransferase family 1 protein, partial [Myxococcota bacterium]
WGWRNPSLDDSLELSTKLLEYAAAGLPIVTNRNQSNESLLVPAYPLYAQSTDDALRLLEEAVGDPALLEEARTMGMRRCVEFTFDRVYDTHLRPFLQRAEGRRGLSRRPRRILVAGHDLRFITDIVAQLQRDGHTVMLDKWRGHMSHDVQESKKLLAKADLVICEWCLGNAVWYTRHVSSEQDLIIRLHLQELQTRHPGKVDFDRVQRVVFVGPYLLEQASTATGWAPERLVTIPNYVDVAQFDRAKIGEHTFNLGMVGCSPARKRLDLALDILERLRARDRRFTLFVKGKLPWDYDWLWKRRNEREYYERTFERIRRSPLLRDSVVFDSYGDDVAAWFRKIGFLLSPSDFESFHVAIVEGGASRSVPVVLAWKGAERLYPREWIHCRPDDAARRILQVVAEGSHARIGDECHEYVAERFSVERVMDQWRDLVDDPRSFRGGG